MTDMLPSRLGRIRLTGDELALFEDVYLGEILTAFHDAETLESRTMARTITSGDAAKFDALFKASGGYHTPGETLTGSGIAHAKVTINVDDLLVSDIFIDKLDEAMNHYNVRSPYSFEQGEYLAGEKDKNIARNLIRSHRGQALFDGDVGGASLNDADADTSAISLAGSFWTAKQTMEEASVPVDRMAVTAAVKPAQWYLLAQEPTLILNRDIGGEGGSYARGTLPMIGGIDVIKSNQYPWGVDDSNNLDIPADYRVNMSTTVASVFVEQAVGTVNLVGMNYETVELGQNRGVLLIAEYACGHGPVRTKCGVEIRTADPS